MSDGSAPATYVIDRRKAALSRPRFEDVNDRIGDLLPAFCEDVLRHSFGADAMTIVFGERRARQMFPPSNRFRTRALVEWEASTKATLLAEDGFAALFDPELSALMPYAVLPVPLFQRPLRSIIGEMQRRLGLTPDGFALLWIGSGGHVTPLHHDGPMVHGRWHLVVHGYKRFDLLPPRTREVTRLAPWDLYRRFSPLYKAPLPDSWFGPEAGARFELAPGQMVTWGRRWWHRVEVRGPGVTIALSTRGQRREEMFRPRGLAHLATMRLIGDVEHNVEARAGEPALTTLDEVRARCS